MGVDSIEFTLDRPRRIRYTFDGLMDLQDALGGKPLGDTLRSVFDMGARELRAVLWAGLRHEDKGLTLQQTGDLIATWMLTGEMRDLRRAIDLALMRSGAYGRPERVEAEFAATQGNGSAAPGPSLTPISPA